jgi:dipeptidyl aminopeptidase/acylaminoacyl peptidase
MRRILLVAAALSLHAADWSLETLYKRPFVWGQPPERLTWSRAGHTLAFLWNAEGRTFREIYVYHPDAKRLTRLTALEGVKDEFNAGEDDKDERLRKYKAPETGIASFDLARDGSQVAFAFRGDLYTATTDGSKPLFRLTRTKDAESAPQFSPDGKRLAFQRGGQLYVQDLATGQLSQITEVEAGSGSLTSCRWSPDGSRFVYSVQRRAGRQVPLPNYSGHFVTARPIPRTVPGDEPGESAMFLIPAEGGKAVAVESGPWGAKVYGASPEWSPDSARLAFAVVHPSMKKQQILVVDAVTGKAKAIWEEADPKWVQRTSLGWSPGSKEVFFLSEADGFSHLCTVSAEGGTPRQATRGNWEIHPETSAGEPQWIGEYLYYSSTEAGTAERQFYRLRPDGTAKQKLSSREGINLGLVSEDGRHTAWMLADLQNPMDLWVDGERITQSVRKDFRQFDWPATRFVTFPSKGDGKTVAAKMLLPPGYRPEDKSQKPRPAVVYIHGAGYATSVLKQWGSYNELRYLFNCYLAHKGYVVLDLDYRGSSGYGREWRTDVYLHMGGKDLEDVLGGVEYLRSLGNIDIKRLGIWGVSYGGFMTNMAMFLAPDTFRAGASWAAVNDWQNYNAVYTSARLTTPKENPEAYRRSSPINFSSMLKNKLLIVHGMVDNNVMFQDAVQLTEKLIQEGKDFSHIYYPEESHAFVREETLIDAYRRTAEWFDTYLK